MITNRRKSPRRRISGDLESPRVHVCISRRAIGVSAREGKAGGRGDEDGDENGEKTRQKVSGVTRVEVKREQGEERR